MLVLLVGFFWCLFPGFDSWFFNSWYFGASENVVPEHANIQLNLNAYSEVYQCSYGIRSLNLSL